MVWISPRRNVAILGLALWFLSMASSAAVRLDARSVTRPGLQQKLAANIPQPWLDNLEAGLALATVEYRPVLMLFSSPECGWCQRLKTDVMQDPALAELLGQFVRVELDAGIHRETAAQYGVRGVPALRLLRADGFVQGGADGYMDAAALRQLLEPSLNPEIVRTMQAPSREVLALLKGTAVAPADWPAILEALGQESLRDEIRDRIMQLNPFPGGDVVALLAHPRLAVRTGALDLLEELAGSTFGFDPWQGGAEAGDAQGEALARWQSWAGGMTGKVDTVYASLDEASITRHVQDLVSGERERSLRAMRLLGQGGEGVAAALVSILAEAPDLDEGARCRIREVQYTLALPRRGTLPPEETAHRLVYGNPDVRLRTLSSLAALGKRALPILREFLGDPDPMVRETAVEAMLAAGQRLALADVGSLLQSETDRHVQHAVLRGLGGVRSRAGMLMLLPYVAHADESLAVASLDSLSRLEFRDPVDAVGKALEDPRWRVRAAALETAGKLNMSTLAGKVVELLRREQDRFVRVTAVRTLAALEARQSAPVLAEWFAQDDTLKGPVIAAYAEMDIPLPQAFIDAVKKLSGDALLSVVQVLPDTDEQGLPLAAALASHPETDVACVALRLLGSYAGRKGQYMPMVVEALRSDSRARQLAVLEAVNRRDYYDNEAVTDFDALAAEEAAEATPQAAAPDGGSPVDDLFAAFADPAGRVSLTAANPGQDVPATSSVADASPVDDLFADFAAAANPGQGILVTSSVAVVSGPLAGVAGARPGLLESLVGLFMPGSSEPGYSSSRSAQMAVSWTEFGTAAAVLLASGEPDVRLEAALWMGSQGDARAVPELVADPASRTSAQRVAIASMLARILHRDGFERLVSFLDDPDSSVREQAVAVLFGSRIGMERIFATLQKPGTRMAVADVVTADLPDSRPELREPLRTHALALLQQQPGSEALQNAGLILLSEAGDARDRAAIEPLLDAQSPYQRRAAWFALARIDRPRFEEQVARVAGDASARVRVTVPAVYSQGSAPWVHFLDAETPLRGKHYSDYSSMRGLSRRAFPVTVREVLASLCQDPDAGVRFEALFCLLNNRQPLDLQQLVEAAEALPDRKAAGQRIASFMMMNSEQLGKAFSVLLPYIEDSSFSDSSLERLRKRLADDSGEAGEGVIFKPLQARHAEARQGEGPEAADTPPESPALHAVFFTKPGCRECLRVEAMLETLRTALPELTIETLEIGRPAAMRLNQVLCGRFRAPTAMAGVTPAIFSGGGYLIRDGFSADSLGALLAASSAIPLAEWRTVSEADEAVAAVAIEERFSDISVLLLLAYALSDSVNPCAFAAIIFFISYLQVTRRSPREIAQVALAFIAAVFLTYLALGFGIGEALARLSALRRAGALMNVLMAALTLVLALLSLNDARLCARGRMEAMTLQLPALLKRRIHSVIRGNARQRAFVLAAFSTGVLISVLELACTGQAYLPAIHYMLRSSDRIWDAAGYLVLYNLAFVAPLFVIFGLVYRGMRSERMVEWLRRHAAAVKLVSALLFLVLFVILLRHDVLPNWQAYL